MASPNMATITASLERSFQKCSLNNNTQTNSDEGSEKSTATTSSTPHHHHHHRHDRHLQNANDTTLELNSHISLPYHWEQCLDLKTGEIYYVNWRNGMKAKQDPRTSIDDITASSTSDYYYDEDEDDDDEEEEEDEDEEEESSYDSEESSSENSTLTSRTRPEARANITEDHGDDEMTKKKKSVGQEVLVVGGCKGCFMYFMVPKHVHDCPKCCGQLLHFDRSENGSL